MLHILSSIVKKMRLLTNNNECDVTINYNKVKLRIMHLFNADKNKRCASTLWYVLLNKELTLDISWHNLALGNSIGLVTQYHLYFWYLCDYWSEK